MFQRKAQESHGFKAARNLPHHSTSPILPEDGSSSRKRWIVSFSQGNATLRCFTEQNTWQRASILLHTHPGFRVSLIHQGNCSNCKHKKSANSQFHKNYIAFLHSHHYGNPGIPSKIRSLWFALPTLQRQGSRSMTCSKTAKPCPEKLSLGSHLLFAMTLLETSLSLSLALGVCCAVNS